MTSDRMMQVIGRIERAITRIEAAAVRRGEDGARQASDFARLKGALLESERQRDQLRHREEERQRQPAVPPMPARGQAADPHAMNPFSHDKALAALRSLDTLIDDLQKGRSDG